MTRDADLIAALRKCEHCYGTGISLPPPFLDPPISQLSSCSHCRLARMAADRIEHYRSAAETNNEASKMLKELVAGIVKSRCIRGCRDYAKMIQSFGDYKGAAVIDKVIKSLHELTVEDLLKP